MRYDEALEAVEKVIKLDPNDRFSWQSKAELLYHLRRPDDALRAVDEAIRLDQGTGYSFNLKGVILTDCGRYEEALQNFELALQKKTSSLYWFNKGAALARLKRYDEARDAVVCAIDSLGKPLNKQEKRALKEYRAALRKLRGAGERISWWDWWFQRRKQTAVRSWRPPSGLAGGVCGSPFHRGGEAGVVQLRAGLAHIYSAGSYQPAVTVIAGAAELRHTRRGA